MIEKTRISEDKTSEKEIKTNYLSKVNQMCNIQISFE